MLHQEACLSRPIVIPQRREEAGLRIEKDLFLQTPALIGGGDPRNSAEFRLSSLLGMLRFWWRVAQPAGASLKDLQSREIRIFGGPASDKAGGNGVFSCWFEPTEPARSLSLKSQFGISKDPKSFYANKTAKFLGGGIMKRDKAIATGYVGKLILQYHGQSGDEDRKSVKQALDLLLAFGGVGLLSRRGLGSLSAHAPGTRDAADELKHKSDLIRQIRNENSGPGTRASFSSSARCCAVILGETSAQTSLEALSEYLVAYVAEFNVSYNQTLAPEDFLSGQKAAKGVRQPSPLFIHIESLKFGEQPISVVTLLYLPTRSAGKSLEDSSVTDRIEHLLESVKDKFDGDGANEWRRIYRSAIPLPWGA